jgi:Protein kinase domain
MGDDNKFVREKSVSAAGSGRDTVLVSDPPAPVAPVASGANAETVVAPRGFAGLAPETLAALSVRYEILGEAGSGSMGNVYKARDRETGGIVALKLLKPEIASDQQMMDRFKRELLFARKITHKNVCRVYEFNRANGVAYTSMEFVEGESLRALLNRERVAMKRAAEIALEICSGLKEAHAQGIVHRDLKPENVMVDAAGHVKIMDFGIARSMDAGTRMTGSLAGTPAYMAPEQVLGKPVDYRTDIYSVGLVLYEMYTGSPAFKAENSVAVALKQMSEDVVPPHAIEPGIPLTIERAILKCLEKEPQRRFLSIGELEAALAAPHAPRHDFASRAAAEKTQAAVTVANAATALQPVAQARQVIAPVFAKPPVATKGGASPFLWILVGVGLSVVVLGVLWAGGVSKQAKQIVFHETFKAPKPPEFAYEIPKAPVEIAPIGSAPVVASVKKTPEPTAVPPHEAVAAAPVPVAKKPINPPEVFPRMETGPVRARIAAALKAARPEAVAAVPNEYIWAGRFDSQSKARERQKVVERMLLPSEIAPHHSSKGDAYVLWVGPVKTSRAPFDVKNLKAKGFANAKETPTAEYQRAQK